MNAIQPASVIVFGSAWCGQVGHITPETPESTSALEGLEVEGENNLVDID